MKKNFIDNSEDRLSQFGADYFLALKRTARESSGCEPSRCGIDHHERRTGLQNPVCECDSDAVLWAGIFAPFADDEIPVGVLLVMPWSPFDEIGGQRSFELVYIPPDSASEISAAFTWTEGFLIAWIDLQFQGSLFLSRTIVVASENFRACL